MLVVTISGKYTPENYLHLFKTSEKCKVLIHRCSSSFEDDYFYTCAIVSTMWANNDKFIKNLAKHKELNIEIVDTLESSPIPRDDDTYTIYDVELDIPFPHENTLHDLLAFMTSKDNTIISLDLSTITTQITFQSISRARIVWAVKGDYKQSLPSIDDLVVCAESCFIPISYSLKT